MAANNVCHAAKVSGAGVGTGAIEVVTYIIAAGLGSPSKKHGRLRMQVPVRVADGCDTAL
jgi:molybdopterin/thiamine biosynthesis adenylyltransferase